MTCTWADFAAAEPDLADTIRQRFAGYRHHVLATVRADGSPRVSGLEINFRHGQLWLGMMPASRKGADLRRDPRFAVQVNPGAGTDMDGGDVRISGRAVRERDAAELDRFVEEAKPPEPFELYRADLTEVVRTRVEDDMIVVQLWRPGAAVREFRRS